MTDIVAAQVFLWFIVVMALCVYFAWDDVYPPNDKGDQHGR